MDLDSVWLMVYESDVLDTRLVLKVLPLLVRDELFDTSFDCAKVLDDSDYFKLFPQLVEAFEEHLLSCSDSTRSVPA